MNRVVYGYDLQKIQPVEEIKNYVPGPVLILHCRDDELVGMWHPEKLMKVVPYAEVSYFDDCEHAENYPDYPQEYEALLIPF
jgi:hypothetical protein